MLEFINNNILIILFVIVSIGAVGSLIWYFATSKRFSMGKKGRVEKHEPNCYLHDLKEGCGLAYVDMDEALKDWTIDTKNQLRQWRIGNKLVPSLIKSYDGSYSNVKITKELKYLPERAYRHLNGKAWEAILISPGGLAEKIAIGAIVVLGIVALFIVYLLMNTK